MSIGSIGSIGSANGSTSRTEYSSISENSLEVLEPSSDSGMRAGTGLESSGGSPSGGAGSDLPSSRNG